MNRSILSLRNGAILACVSLLVGQSSALHAKGKNKQGDAPTPASLVDDMKLSFAFIVKNAGDISPKSKQALPFWSALKTISEGIDEMDAGIKAKNAGMIKGLDVTGRGITQLSATWAIIRGAHPKSTVGRGVISLSSAYEMFQEHYGPAVARYKKKAKLTEQEVALIETCGGQLESLYVKLEKVAAAARANSYEARLILDLISLIEELDEIEGENVRAYAMFIYQWNRIQYALQAYSEIVSCYYPEYYTTWSILDEDALAMSTVFEETLWSSYETWDYTSESIEEYDDYYEETAVVETVTEEEESQFEEIVESYDEEAAIEESDEEMEELAEEVSIDEDEEDSLFEEAEDSYGDDDGDGIDDEEDSDDDNDGISDEEDTDDDGDCVSDEEDGDCSDDEAEEMEEEGDDDGIAEECEAGCCGTCE